VLLTAAVSVLAQTPESEPHVDLITIDGSINPAVDDFIRESISRAKAGGARALIIQLDTPGGLLSSTRTIVKELLGTPVPVMVYVAPSGAGAGSAGVFITMAANIAAMAPGTNIGAAHPVAGGGQEVKGVMGEKIENFTASFSESIAQQRGRNTEWAIDAVRKSVAITETEALKKKVIDIVARDVDDLLKQAHGRKLDIQGRKQELSLQNVKVVRHEMNLKQKVLNTIADPNGVLASRNDISRRSRRDLFVVGFGVVPTAAYQLHGARADDFWHCPSRRRGVFPEFRRAGRGRDHFTCLRFASAFRHTDIRLRCRFIHSIHCGRHPRHLRSGGQLFGLPLAKG
jgi:ATP-dependent protease ClpP protease subunit